MKRIMILLASASLLLGGATIARAETIEVDLNDFEIKTPDAEKEHFGYDTNESRFFFFSNGTCEASVKILKDAEYTVTINASCTAAENEMAKFKFYVDAKQVGDETSLKKEEADDYKFTVKLKAGKAKLGIEFTNDKYKEGEYDLNFFMHAVTLKSK